MPPLSELLDERVKECEEATNSWRKEFAGVKKKYDDYISETGTRKSLSTKRGSMKRRLGEIKSEMDEAEQIAGKWQATWTEAIELAGRLDAALSERFQIRLSKARELTKLSEGVLKLSVAQASDHSSAYRVLKGVQSGLHSQTLELLTENVPAHHLVLLLLDPGYGVDHGFQDDQLEKLRYRVLTLDDRISVLKSFVRALPDDIPLIEYRKGTWRVRSD